MKKHAHYEVVRSPSGLSYHLLKDGKVVFCGNWPQCQQEALKGDENDLLTIGLFQGRLGNYRAQHNNRAVECGLPQLQVFQEKNDAD